MNVTMICEHCGRDHGPEYHRGMDPGDGARPARVPDPRVCDRCCRDTTPEAGPSTWSPLPQEEEVGQYRLALYDVRRICRCGAEWMGKTFVKPVEEEIRRGWCAECLVAEEVRMAALMHPVLDRGPSKDTVLERPRTAREYGDDELPLDGKMLTVGADT